MSGTRPRVRRAALLCFLIVLNGALLVQHTRAFAAPEVKFFFPPGGERGQTVEVKAGGKFAAWPVRVWVDRPGLEVTPLETKGALSVRVAADARRGVYWVRLYDESGSAVPRPFVVGTIHELAEVEPNNTLDAAQGVGEESAAATTVLVNGQLKGGGDVDLFAVPAKAGQWLVADLDAHVPLDAPFDGVLQVVSPEGFVQAQNDDHQGLDPRVAFQVPYDGVWRVRVFGFPATPNSTIGFAADESYIYRLTLTTAAYVDYTRPMAASRSAPTTIELHGWNLPPELKSLSTAPTDQADCLLERESLCGALRLPVVEHENLLESEPSSLEAPHAVPVPCTVTGRIESSGDKDVYSLPVEKGAILAIRVESRALGYDLDPVVTLLDAEGKQLATADDVGEARDAELVYTAAADGMLRLVVSDLHRASGERFVYRLSVERAKSDFRLTLESHELVLAAGGTVELPVKVDRLHGFGEPVAVSVEGLPEGITATTATSQPDDDSKAKVTLTLTAAADAPTASVPLRVVGGVGGQASQRASISVPGHAGAKLDDLWLTVTKAAQK